MDRLDLDVPHGKTCVLIGPSGCGKTTTMRMVNRLIEPTSGRIFVEGEDVTRADPVLLRRRIGYVIQQIGLFPHMTIAENVATVPQAARLAGGAHRAARVDEMLALVGLDPGQYLDALSAPPLGRPAPARRRGAGAGRRPAGDADGRAVRRRRSRSCARGCRTSSSASCASCARP